MDPDASPSHCPPPDKFAIHKFVQNLNSGKTDDQREASEELRRLAKLSSANRICIAEAGGVQPFVKLLRSCNSEIQAHSIAALLNLTIRNEENKNAIVMAKGLDPIVDVLRKGRMQETKENAAALLFNLSCSSSHRTLIATCDGVFTGLADLLTMGSVRGKKDAAAALFNLLQMRHCRVIATRAGVVAPLLQLAQDPSSGLVDESLTVLSNLAAHQEGRFAIHRASGIRTLLELLRKGSDSNKEYACAVLYVLCHDDFTYSEEASRLGAEEILLSLSVTGSEKVRRKAAKVLELLR